MIDHPTATRQEATDIEITVLDGADGFMLGKETSHGCSPVHSIDTLAQIIVEGEKTIDGVSRFKKIKSKSNLEDKNEILASLIGDLVIDQRAEPIDLILCLSELGKMPRILSKYKLPIPLLAACPESNVVKQMNFMSGIIGIKVPNLDEPDHLIKIMLKTLSDIIDTHPGHMIIVVRSKFEDTPEEHHHIIYHKVQEHI